MKLTSSKIISILHKNFPYLSNDDIDSFLKITTYSKVDKKEILIEKGNQPKQIFFILSGYVRGYITNELGLEKIILLRDKGYFIGDAEKIFYDRPQKYTYATIKESHVLFLNYDNLESLAFNNPLIMRLLLNIFKEIMTAQNHRIESLISMDATNRYEELIEKKPGFLKEIHSKFLANFIGITPVSLSRIQKKISSQ
ncbi:MAG: Crp/Fnr family transcriptional regulator [Flavobacteriaceae bacterium]